MRLQLFSSGRAAAFVFYHGHPQSAVLQRLFASGRSATVPLYLAAVLSRGRPGGSSGIDEAQTKLKLLRVPAYLGVSLRPQFWEGSYLQYT